jgi:hypothetical protein
VARNFQTLDRQFPSWRRDFPIFGSDFANSFQGMYQLLLKKSARLRNRRNKQLAGLSIQHKRVFCLCIRVAQVKVVKPTR